MSRKTSTLAVLVFAGVGFGSFIGVILGWFFGRKRGGRSVEALNESVQTLQNRAHQVLLELSNSVGVLNEENANRAVSKE